VSSYFKRNHYIYIEFGLLILASIFGGDFKDRAEKQDKKLRRIVKDIFGHTYVVILPQAQTTRNSMFGLFL